MKRPNIVYLHSHDTGRYIQPYGHAVRTPRLQRFAEQGVVFRQAFCANPTCSPSRAALLTGQCAHSAGMFGLAHRGFAVADMSRHLVHTLKPAGYHTVLGGQQHVAEAPEQIGYDQLLKPSSNHVADAAPPAAAFLRQAPADRPFFLDIGFFETHRTFPEPDSDNDPRFTRPPAPLPDTPEIRRDMAGFNTMAGHLDAGVGQILDAIDQAGLADSTLVIITTDHGPAFPAMKCNVTDHGIGVMLMMRGPAGPAGRFDGGRVVDAMVSHVDVFPTLCHVADITPPPWLEGTSILPLLTGEADHIRDEIFAEVNYHVTYEPMRAVRTGRYKYIRRYEPFDQPQFANCDNGASKSQWLDCGWDQRRYVPEQLFDLMFDPNEVCNLAGEPAQAEVLADMRRRLDRWMRDTNDPLLQGPVPAPPGAKVT